MKSLREKILRCEKCKLGRTSPYTQPIPGVGPTPAPLCFIGRDPGAAKDNEAEEKELDRAMALVGVSRRKTGFFNVVSCCTPRNRDPAPNEINACDNWFRQQLTSFNPFIIVPLGVVASEKFFPGLTIGRLRGHAYQWKGRWVVPTWPPSYVLQRGRDAQTQFEDDILLAAALLWQHLGRPSQTIKAVDGPTLINTHFNHPAERLKLNYDLENLLERN